MERLTPVAELAYPVERTIMESAAAEKTTQNPQEARMGKIIADFKKELNDKKGPKIVEKEASRGGGGKSGIFDKFDSERFSGNSSVEELAKLVRAAGRKGEIDEKFLEEIKSQLDRRTQLGLISDNWNQTFTDYLNGFIVSVNLERPKKDTQELSEDIEAIIAHRKANRLSADEIEASRARLEAAYGRRLTEAEFQRSVMGRESMAGVSREFDLQIKTIEKLAGNPKRLDSFTVSITKEDPETVKRALSGPAGKVVLGILMGDIADDRDVFNAKLDELLKSFR